MAAGASDLKADPRSASAACPTACATPIARTPRPAGQASLRLRFDAGSLMETRRPAGPGPLPGAHGLQRLEGTCRRARWSRSWSAIGLAFGADTNASTSFDETVYKLDLPKTDDDTVDTSLMLLREVAGELTLAQAPMDRERGVVLSEERAARQPRLSRLQGAAWASCCPASWPPDRLPDRQGRGAAEGPGRA